MKFLFTFLFTISLLNSSINFNEKQIYKIKEIIKVCKQHKIKDTSLYLAIAYVESEFNPNCKYKDSYGMFQNRIISVKAREKLNSSQIKLKLKDTQFSLNQCKKELEYWKARRKSITSVLAGYNNGYNTSSKGYNYARKVLYNKKLIESYLKKGFVMKKKKC